MKKPSRPAHTTLHAVVNVALAIHPPRQPVRAQHIDGGLLEYARPDARENVVAAVLLQHHARNAVAMQDLGQQQAGGTAADDGNLGSHRLFHGAPQIL
jgi:hypothetical protein